MSIMQVMIAMSITFLIASLVLQTILQMRQVENLMSLNSEVSDIEIAIQRVMITPQACINTLYPKLQITNDRFPVDLDFIYDDHYDFTPGAVNVPVMALNQIVGNNKLSVAKIRLINGYPGVPTTVLTPNVVAKVYLEMQFLKRAAANNANNLGGSYIVRRMPISVQTNEFSQISGCTSLDQVEVANKICDDLGGVINPATQACSLAASTVIVDAICDSLGLGSNGTRCL